MQRREGEQAARSAVARASRRLRYRAGMRRFSLLLPLPLAYSAVALAALKLFGTSPLLLRLIIVGGVVCVATTLVSTLLAAFRRPAQWAPALLLDEHHGLFDRVTSALALLDSRELAGTPMVEAAIDDGLGAAAKLDPRRAVPLPIPGEFAVSALLCGLLLAVAVLELPVERQVQAPLAFKPLVLASDDLELFSDIAKRLAERAEDPGVAGAVRKFNALIEDVAARRLDRESAFQRLGELEAELSESAELDREARDLGIEGLARELQKSPLAKAAAQALEQKRLADAEKALRELSERLRDQRRPPSRAELDRLRNAVERASKVSGERLSALEQRRRELNEEKKSLLKRKDEKKPGAEASKLGENQRKLERLERDQARAERAAKELSELDRELAKAAEDLRKQDPQAAEDIRRTADELGKVQKRELTEKEKRELLERLRELKELMRQQGPGESERQRQLRRFGKRARGGSGDEGEEQPGEGKGGRKPGGPTKLELVPVPRISQRSVPGGGDSDGKPGNEKGLNGSGEGKQAGTGHDEKIAGEATELQGQTHDVTAAAIDTGEGAASAEVIHGAAERGFVGKAYKDIYVDYETVAEQSLEHDTIPPGYRFYVRRYFQLIRPRE